MSPRDPSAGRAASREPRSATVEDYHSDEDDPVPEPVKEANSKVRRKLGLSSAALAKRDAASDSGYSSHPAAAATAPSSDSTTPSATLPPSTKAASQPRRRPTLLPSRTLPAQPYRPPAPEVVPPVDPRRQAGSAQHDRCHCAECMPRRKSVAGPLDTPWHINYTPFEPGRKPTDPRMQGTNQKDKYEDPPAPAPRPPMVKTYSSRSVRPMTYHEGIGYSSAYLARMPERPAEPRFLPPHPIVTNLPPSVGSFSALPNFPLQSPSMSTPQQQYPMPLPYADTRPPPQRWVTEQYSARPVSTYGPPLVGYGVGPAPVLPVMHRRASTREPSSRRPRIQEEEDYFLMPPPPLPPGVVIPRPGVRYQSNAAPTGQLPRPSSMSRADESREMPPDGLRRAKTYREHQTGLSQRAHQPYAQSERQLESRITEPTDIQMAEKRRRRASQYGYEGDRGPAQTVREYRDSDTKPSSHQSSETLGVKGSSSRAGSDTGSQGKTFKEREGNESRRRPLSGIAVSVPDSEDSFTMRFASSTGVKLDFTGGFEGRTVSLRPGQDGEQAELSIGARKGYIEGSSGPQTEYARSGRRREIEDRQGAGQSRSSTQSRRSSRAPSRRDPMF